MASALSTLGPWPFGPWWPHGGGREPCSFWQHSTGSLLTQQFPSKENVNAESMHSEFIKKWETKFCWVYKFIKLRPYFLNQGHYKHHCSRSLKCMGHHPSWTVSWVTCQVRFIELHPRSTLFMCYILTGCHVSCLVLRVWISFNRSDSFSHSGVSSTSEEFSWAFF